MSETLTTYDALKALEFDPATLAVTVKQQSGFDYGDPPTFRELEGLKVTYIAPETSVPMLRKSATQTLADLGLTGAEPMIQVILTMIEAAKAAQAAAQQ